MARKPKVTPDNVIAALQKANGLQAGAVIDEVLRKMGSHE